MPTINSTKLTNNNGRIYRGGNKNNGCTAYTMIKDLLAVSILVALIVMNYLNISVIHIFEDDTTGTTSHYEYVQHPVKEKSVLSKSRDSASSKFVVDEHDYIYGFFDYDSAPIVVKEHKLIFFTIPKVACTTFKFLFRRMRGVKDWDNQDTEKGLPHNPSLNNLQYLWDFDIETANEMMTSPE